jgi:hypothetical protein
MQAERRKARMQNVETRLFCAFYLFVVDVRVMMGKDQITFERFLNILEGEVVPIVSRVSPA